MAWNESFTGGDAGGWGGDASFATSGPRDTSSNKTAERLAVPVSISDLFDGANPEEKHVLGDYPFSTVLLMGSVVSVEEEDNMSTSYIVCDPEDSTKEFKVTMYNGLDDGTNTVAPIRFAEGTRIMTLGKLRSFSDTHAVMAYTIREVLDDKEYHAFTLEAKVAKLYFAKGIQAVLQSGDGRAAELVDCCAGAPAPIAGGAAVKAEVASTFSSQSTSNRIYQQNQSGASHGLSGNRGKILDIMNAEKDNISEAGMNINEIKSKTGITNHDALHNDLQFLVSEGHLYNTVDDDSYALISS